LYFRIFLILLSMRSRPDEIIFPRNSFTIFRICPAMTGSRAALREGAETELREQPRKNIRAASREGAEAELREQPRKNIRAAMQEGAAAELREQPRKNIRAALH
jgi:hypothetical protein